MFAAHPAISCTFIFVFGLRRCSDLEEVEDGEGICCCKKLQAGPKFQKVSSWQSADEPPWTYVHQGSEGVAFPCLSNIGGESVSPRLSPHVFPRPQRALELPLRRCGWRARGEHTKIEQDRLLLRRVTECSGWFRSHHTVEMFSPPANLCNYNTEQTWFRFFNKWGKSRSILQCGFQPCFATPR